MTSSGSVVWLQSDTYNTMNLTDYRVVIEGSTYAMYVNDDVDPLLSGALPYFAHSSKVPNTLMIGDTANSVSANVDIYQIATSLGESAPSIPEPATLILTGCGLVALLRKLRAR